MTLGSRIWGTCSIPLAAITKEVVVDGNAQEWGEFPLTATGEGDVFSMKAFASNKKISILAHASTFDEETNIFIDSDNNHETGYQGWEFKRTGADYLVQNEHGSMRAPERVGAGKRLAKYHGSLQIQTHRVKSCWR